MISHSLATGLLPLRGVEILTTTWPIVPSIAAFVVGATMIAVFGTRLASAVAVLAARTGIGEAMAGAVLLGAATSLSGLVVSVLAALDGNASLAVSNASGGIAAQTAFIVAADLFYRRANLEHAAASLVNMFNAVLMIALLGIVLLGTAAPPLVLLGVHPVTPVLFLAYTYGLYVGNRIRRTPMWRPLRTTETRPERPNESSARMPAQSLWGSFALFGASVAGAGWLLAHSGLSIIEQTGLSGTIVGVLFTSVATSIPELVTSIAAVRAGALALAVGGIIGGNTFDVLFIAIGDVLYRSGSIYEALHAQDLFAIAWTIVLVGVIAAGLIRRQRRGIGFEGYAVIALYLAGLAVIVAMG